MCVCECVAAGQINGRCARAPPLFLMEVLDAVSRCTCFFVSYVSLQAEANVIAGRFSLLQASRSSSDISD